MKEKKELKKALLNGVNNEEKKLKRNGNKIQ